MAVNWGLGGGGFDALEVLQSYGKAQTQRIEGMRLAAQAKREGVKYQREEDAYQRGEATRTGLLGAYNAQTGAVDPVAARQAYVAGGDVGGAMAFDAQRGKSRLDSIKAELDMAQATTGLLASATDPASYAAARGRAASMGLDVSGVPEQFDPQWVQAATMQSLDAKDRLAAQLAREKFKADDEAKRRDDARQDRVANNGIATSNARLGLARESRAEGRVRFRERDKDRAALAASGGIRTDTSDLDY